MKRFALVFLLFIALGAFLILFTQDYSQVFYPNVHNAHASQGSVTPSVRTYSHNVDVSQSIIAWEGVSESQNVSYLGTIPIASGGADIFDGNFLHGAFVLYMEKIESSEMTGMMFSHLTSDDFLSVEKYPTAYFELRKVERVRDDKYIVSGTLTLLGVSEKVEFPAVIKQENNVYIVGAQFFVDMTRWNMSNFDNTTQDPSLRSLFENVSVTLRLVLK